MHGRNFDIDLDSLPYQITCYNNLVAWLRCEKSDLGLIILKTINSNNIDYNRITIQLMKGPTFQMRIAAEIWDKTLLNHLHEQGFKDYTIPFSDVICGESYCDYRDDAESQARLKLFLTTLVSHSTPLPCQHTLSTSIHNEIKYLASKFVPEKMDANKPKPTYSHCRYFALATAATVTVATVSLQIMSTLK